MRKAQREMSSEWAWEVLKRAPYVTVCMTDTDGTPYAVPLSLACVGDVLYFHCAAEGRKLDILRQNPHVCLSAVSKCRPVMEVLNSNFTLEYECAIAMGVASIVEDDAEKIAGLRAICERFLPQHMDAFDTAVARSLSRTTVVRIRLTAPPTGKCNKAGN